ncbi:ribonuclease E activity regulator RraA [Budvicia diplopodorum]|uniref:ribonuclease E activity regulator RraA n=1 Tax=Budvicia diplopodorum TaxID=1119056 RepID=UPI001358C3A8|nr:ribonuclease E activity regulator RraA [Budvicia diplopodorum]
MNNKNNTLKVADLCDEHREQVRLFAPIFSDFGGKAAFSGQAKTIKCFEDNTSVKALSLTPGHGRILVVDGGGSAGCALLGDNLGANLAKNGWQGAIIYGFIRDKAELALLPIGVKALGSVPLGPVKLKEGIIGQPVEFAGQVINDGDRIFADEDGIIILNLSD